MKKYDIAAYVWPAYTGDIEVFGITDHNYGIGNGRRNVFAASKVNVADDYEGTLLRYFDHINLIKEKYANDIRILRVRLVLHIQICFRSLTFLGIRNNRKL